MKAKQLTFWSKSLRNDSSSNQVVNASEVPDHGEQPTPSPSTSTSNEGLPIDGSKEPRVIKDIPAKGAQYNQRYPIIQI